STRTPCPRRMGPKKYTSSICARIRKKSKKRYRLASIMRNTATSKPTSTNGNGEAVSLLNVSESANPVVTTAQLVVSSSRVRHTTPPSRSPRKICDKAVISAVSNPLCLLSFIASSLLATSVRRCPFPCCAVPQHQIKVRNGCFQLRQQKTGHPVRFELTEQIR